MTHTPDNRIGTPRGRLEFPGYVLRENTVKAEFTLHPLAKPGMRIPMRLARRASQKHLLATLSGAGSLHSSTGEAGAVRYRLPVLQAHGTQIGEGFIAGDDDFLRNTYMDSEHTLQIGDGRHIPILLTRLSSNGAEFRTTGPIPGF